jgi:hypothetical protein
MRVLAALLAVAILVGPAHSTSFNTRIALVIGDDDYHSGLHPLKNAVSDAALISATLRKAGFDVEELHDASRAQTSAALARLGQRIHASGAGSVGLFYFAGHGLQSYGMNYLEPTDAAVGGPDDVSRWGIEADDVLRVMADAGADTNILILDACRPNHVSQILEPVAAAGLAQVDARDKDPDRSFMIAYSTGLGETAADGDAGNSPYARTLAQYILQPGMPLEIMFRNVRVAMVRQGFQKPWESNGMLRGWSFVGDPQEPAPMPAKRIEPGVVIQISDFGSFPAKLGVDSYIPAERYLRQGAVPVTIRDVVPATSEIAFFSTDNLYQGQAVRPTLSGNVLTQIGTGNVPASFTLQLSQPASRVRFLIPRLFAATGSGVTFPAFKATALSASGEAIDSVQDELVRSFTDVPEKFFEVKSRDGKAITAIRFDSDPRLDGRPFAGFSAVLIEGIWIEAMP